MKLALSEVNVFNIHLLHNSSNITNLMFGKICKLEYYALKHNTHKYMYM